MGLFKNAKSDRADNAKVKASALGAFAQASAQAAQLQSQHAGALGTARGMDMNVAVATAQRAQHISKNGIDGTATVISVAPGGPSAIGAGTTMQFDLALIRGPGAPRPLTVHQDVGDGQATRSPGDVIQVRINPDNLDDAILWGTAPTGGDARIMKLEQLATMHSAGAFSDEEFAARKAAVLAAD